MKLSTLALALASVSSTLATNPRAVHIHIDIKEQSQTTTDGLRVSCLESGGPKVQAPVDLQAAIKGLWNDGFKTPTWEAKKACATSKDLNECTISGLWKENYPSSEEMRDMLRGAVQDSAVKGWSNGYCTLTTNRYTLMSFKWSCSGSLIKTIGLAEEQEGVGSKSAGQSLAAKQEEVQVLAVIQAHCDSMGTNQTDPDIDVASGISDIFDTNTQTAPWTGTAACDSTYNTTLCTVTGKYSEPGTCNIICKNKIQVEARKVAKQKNSKVSCWYGVNKAAATAVFEWSLNGSLVKAIASVVNIAEGQKVVNEELK